MFDLGICKAYRQGVNRGLWMVVFHCGCCGYARRNGTVDPDDRHATHGLCVECRSEHSPETVCPL